MVKVLFRIPLTFLAALALLLDLQEFASIQHHGFPPQCCFVLESCGEGCFIIPTPSTEDYFWYVLYLTGLGLVQALIFRLTWMAWRSSKA